MSTTVTSTTSGNNCPAGNTDARCSITVTVSGLTISQTAGTSTAAPGGVVHYTITVTNTGQTPYTGAALTDPLAGVLDDAAYNGDAATTPAATGTLGYASQTLSWTGNLALAATVTITYSVTVKKPDTGDGTLTNTVTSATPGSNRPTTSGTDPRCTATVTVAGLAITNTANVATATPGGIVRYTATFHNTGRVPYTGITIASDITDVLDDAVPNGDQTATDQNGATAGQLTLTGTGITWTGDIPVGGTVTVTGTVTVKSPDPGNKTMTSTLTSTAPGSNCPAGSTDPACTATVQVLTPALTIVKTASTTSTTPGATIGYTITVTNTGTAPYTGATVTDSFTQMADDASYDNDGTATKTSGTLTYDPAALTLTWTGDLAPGARATITYNVTVSNPDTGDKLVINTVTSTAPGATCPPGTTSTSCRITIPVLTPALTITKTASAATAVPGATITYTITVTNTGQTPYTGAALTDPLAGVLDDAAYNGDAATTPAATGTLGYASQTLSWTGNLALAATVTITYSVTVKKPDTGDGTLTNTVTSATPGSNCPTTSGTDPRCTATVTVAGLAITNTANVATATPGGIVRYTATFHNTGRVPTPGSLSPATSPTCSTTRSPTATRPPPTGTAPRRSADADRHRHNVDRGHPGRRHGDRHRHGDGEKP